MTQVDKCYPNGISVNGIHYDHTELVKMYGDHLPEMTPADIRFDILYENPTFFD